MAWQKEIWRREGFFGSLDLITVHHQGIPTQELRNLGEGTEAKSMKYCCLLAYDPSLTQFAFLCNSGSPIQCGTPKSPEGLPISNTNRENVL